MKLLLLNYYKFIKNEVKKIENGKARYYNNERVLQQFKDYLKKSKPEIVINSEVPIKGNNNFIDGYWDIEILIRAILTDGFDIWRQQLHKNVGVKPLNEI